jgi:hypothetical protein
VEVLPPVSHWGGGLKDGGWSWVLLYGLRPAAAAGEGGGAGVVTFRAKQSTRWTLATGRGGGRRRRELQDGSTGEGIERSW